MADEEKTIAEKEEADKEMDALWKTVHYEFISYVQFTSTPTEVLMLVGQRLPPDGKVHPMYGFVLTPTHAKATAKAFQDAMDRRDATLRELKKKLTDVAESPAEPVIEKPLQD
jgi:hypothetical protein